jgi:hypothetical protein
MLAVTVIMDNPATLTNLNQALPGAAWLGIQDVARTFMARVKGKTPTGWIYKKSEKTKKGSLKRGTGKWVKSNRARSAWDMELHNGEMAVSVYNPQPYMQVLERGLYPNPPTGPARVNVPWTPWRVEGGFSKQSPHGIIQPFFDDSGNAVWKKAQSMILDQIRNMLSGLGNG